MFYLRVSNSGKIYQKYVRFKTSFFEFIGLVVQFLSQNTIVLFFSTAPSPHFGQAYSEIYFRRL